MSWLAILSAILMLITAATHAILGERRLIGPMLAYDTGILARPLARKVVRVAWHMTSVLMICTAAAVIWPKVPTGLVRLIGASWLFAGLADLVYTRGKHIGWPFITAAGAAALLA